MAGSRAPQPVTVGRTAAFLLIVALGTLAGCAAPVTPNPSPSSTPATTASLPATAITTDDAARLAAQAVPADAVLRSVVARSNMTIVGPDGAAGVGPAGGFVWVVTFDRTIVICPPDGGPCWSPRPGVSVVILDYRTGAFIESSTNAAQP